MLPGSADSMIAKDFRLTPAARRRSPPPWKPLSTAAADAQQLGARSGNNVAQAAHSLAVCHEIIDDEHPVAGGEPFLAYQQSDLFLVGIRVNIALVQAAFNVVALCLFGEVMGLW